VFLKRRRRTQKNGGSNASEHHATPREKAWKQARNLEARQQLEKTMRDEPMKPDTIFGDAIYRYSRAQALADGVLVDVTEIAREAGFRIHVALTTAVWSQAVAWSDADSARQTNQDEAGRLWDVLWMAYIAARRASGGCQVPFQVHVVPRGGSARLPRLMQLHMHIGPGDDSEPVITIMTPNED